MKFLILFLTFSIQFLFAQEKTTSSYKNGHNGMEYIVSTKKETVIISTFNSKLSIREEIAKKIYAFYTEKEFKSGDSIEIKSDKATVTGKFVVRKNGKLTALEFYYEKIEWASGLTELYTNTD